MKERKEASFKGISFAILATLSARGVGFIREVLMANVFGTTAGGDALIIALNVPTVLVSGISLAIATIYIPAYYKINNELGSEGSKTIGRINWTILCVISALAVIIIGLVWIFPKAVILLFASGFSAENKELCISLLRITIIAILPILYIGLFKAFGQIHNRYGAITLSGTLVNACIISVLIFGQDNILKWLAVASTVGYCLYMIATIIISCYGKKYPLIPKLALNSPYLKNMGIAFLPVLLSNIVTEINQMIDKNFASTLNAGTISALNYSVKLINLVTAVLGTAISSVLFVKLSKISASGDKSRLADSINKENGALLAIILPIFWGTFIFSPFIVQLIYGRGSFNAASIKLTSEALRFYSLGIIGFNLKALWVRCYNASSDTKTPAVFSAVAVVLNVFLNFLLIGRLQHRGLAIATVTASLFTDLMMMLRYKRVNNSFSMVECLKESARVFVASAVFGIVFLITGLFLSSSILLGIVEIAVSFAVGLVLYLLLLVVFKTDCGRMIKSRLKR